MNSLSVKEATTDRSGVIVFIALVACGLIGNYFHYTIFLNIDFLFGSIFSMLVLQFLGLTRGVAASAIIASYTLILWNHPYAIVIMTTEVAVVGLLMQRFKIGLVLADAIYWVIIGIPMVYFFYHIVMSVPLDSTSMVMTKQAINGITNALVARIVYTVFESLWLSSKTSFNENIYNLLAFFVIFPALVFIAISSKNDFNEVDDTIQTRVSQYSQIQNYFISNWISQKSSTLFNLADLAASTPIKEMQSLMDQVSTCDNSLIYIGLMDIKANSVTFLPKIEELGRGDFGRTSAYKSYVAELQRTKKPMFYGTIVERVGESTSTILMLAPVLVEEHYAGYIVGAINLDGIIGYLDQMVSHDQMLYTLLDPQDKVIATNHAGQKVMQPFVREKGTFDHLQNGVSRWAPQMPPNTPIMEQWKQSVYISEFALAELGGWKFILEQPVAPFQGKLYNNYTHKLSLLLIMVLLSLALAELLSRRMCTTFDKLSQITKDFPQKLIHLNREILWPKSSIAEASCLIENFKEMSETISRQLIEINDGNIFLKQLVSEVQQSEERLQTIVNNSPFPTAVVDQQDDSVLYWSQSALELFGHNPQKVTEWYQLAYPDPEYRKQVTKRWKPFLEETVQSKRAVNTGEYKIACKDGTIKTCELYVQLIPGYLIVTLNNITDRKILEKQLLQAQKMESIGNLAGGIAHEFNNMLAIIMGNNQLIEEELPEESLAREGTEEIRIAGLRASDVVKQLLTFSRQDDAIKKVMDFNFVVQESIKLIRSSIPANIQIEQNISADTYPVIGNETQINQILINLCNNSVDALSEKNGKITIELLNETIDIQQTKHHIMLKPGRYVKLLVSDNGSGMDTEILDRVFDPYFTTKAIGEGTGIGLAVVHGIVERHGGAISVNSEPGRGTTFTIFLPDHEHLIERKVGEQESFPGGDEQILYVDDEPSIAIIGERLLKSLGYRAESATDPLKVLDMIKSDQNKFDLVITDMAMPDMTGDQLISEILKIRREMPTIICTGYSSTISEKEAAEIGAHSYLMKPVDKSELAKVVRRVLDDSKKVRSI